MLLIFTEVANAGSFELAAKMQNAGANELALSYMQRNAPPPDATRELWGALEIRLLSRFSRDRAVLDIAASLPFSRETALLAAKSAFNLGKPSLARDWLAQLIWHGDLSKTELRQARLQVIESYAGEKDGKSAYYAMLRFDQDYRPLTKIETSKFVDGLLSTGMAKDSAAWLTLLDDADPLKLRAELETGLMSPDDVISAAKGNPDILLEAAKMKGDASLEIKSLEALVSAGKIPAEALWKSYLGNAIAFSNRYALLQGDYAAWFDAIAKMDDASARRSLLAHLSLHAENIESRNRAVLLMIASLKDSPKIAVGIFSKSSDIPPEARLALGNMAFQSGNYADCTHFWDALPGADALDLALAWLKTGQSAKAASALDQYLGTVKALDPATSSRILALAKLMVSMNEPASNKLLSALTPLVDIETRREFLVLLGKTSTDPQTAAAYYFEAATSIEAKQTDDLARSARLSCAESLQQAGFVQDARAQYKWLLSRTRDPAGIRELKRRLQ